MVRPKTSSKKTQKRGVDFKKYKRKLGRKLPPPKNATSTEIKSKAIILPEQSVASERVGLALSKKGLTLKELLQQTSHHNAKVRRDALIGIRDLASKNPAELKLHKLAIIEKLRERISDDDKVVRETLYQLFKSVIFPGCKEEIPGPIISLIMAYIFNAMTHLAFDIRLMAFQFFELVVQHYPSSFLLYAEKILQNYADILRKSQSYLQDKGKLKNSLGGLVRCLSLFLSDGANATSSYEMITEEHGALHAFETEVPTEHTDVSSIVNKLEDLMPVLLNCFQELTPSVVGKPLKESPSFDCMLSVLQSIDLALKYFVYQSSKYQQDSKSLVSCTYKTTNAEVWGETTLPNLLKKLLEVFPLGSVNDSMEKNDERYYVLNVVIAEIFLIFNDWIGSSISMEKVLEFLENALCGKICCRTWSSKSVREKHLLPLLPFIPKLVLRADTSTKDRVLKAFTKAFKDCKPESPLKLACLSAIEEMLLPSNSYDKRLLDTSDPELMDFQIEWIRELPTLLVQLGDRSPSSSKIVLHLHLRLGQHVPMDSTLAFEYDKTQDSLAEFYCTFRDESNVEGGIHYGPFIMLPKDSQEVAISSLYYFSHWDCLLLKSVTYCCLCHSLDPDVIFRIIEVLQLSYNAGHIQIADHISFLVTLLARFGAYPEKIGSEIEKNEKSKNHVTLKAITSAVCSCLFQMGDTTLVFQILQKVILYEMSQSPPLENMCAMLRALASLDSRPTLLPAQKTVCLGNSIIGYMLDSVYSSPKNIPESTDSEEKRLLKYYFVPCFILFYKNDKLLNRVLSLIGSFVAETRKAYASHQGDGYSVNWSNRIKAVVSILLFMHKDVKMQRSLSCDRAEVRHILQELILFQSSNDMNLSLEERHKMQVSVEELKTVTGRLHRWSADDLKRT